MKIFLTGATGFIGSAVIPELLQAGHQVIGLTRSDEGAKALEAAGAEVHRGTLEDTDSLRAGAAKAEAVIHCAFDHNFANFMENVAKDTRAIKALTEELEGSKRPLLVTSGVGFGIAGPGQLAREDVFNHEHGNPRAASEIEVDEAVQRGVNASVVRLPQVHDTVKQGLVTYAVALAREKGVAAYVGDGSNRWSAAHVSDVARLYRLAIEKQEPGARWHAVDEEGVSAKAIAEAVAKGLGVPAKSVTAEEAAEHFGWMAMFAGMDLSASSQITRERLGWKPTGPTLLEDLAKMKY